MSNTPKFICENGICRIIKEEDDNTEINTEIITETTEELEDSEYSDEESDDNTISFPDESVEWVIYGTQFCGFCNLAKVFLDDRNIHYEYVDIIDYGMSNVIDKFSDLTNNYKSIPMIFNYGKFIGGFNELKSCFE